MLIKKRDFEIADPGISSVQQVRLGGIDQFILIQAENPGSPVLLLLHGGPSMPLPGVSAKGQDYTIVTNTRQLVKHFVVVFWDQRGTGKSYSSQISQDSMNIEQFIADAGELTDYLRSRFRQNKIFLAGHSWGTTIGFSLAARFPEKYYAYTGFSQIVSWTENDRLSLAWLKNEAKRRGNNKAINELESIGQPPFTRSFSQWAILRTWQRNFNTLIYSDDQIKHPGFPRIVKDMLRSETYTLKDIFNSFYRGFKLTYSQRFIEQLDQYDFMVMAENLSVPVTFVHGVYDYQVHGSLVEQFYKKMHAPSKKMIWASKSGHAFHPDDTKLNEQYLIQQLSYMEELS